MGRKSDMPIPSWTKTKTEKPLWALPTYRALPSSFRLDEGDDAQKSGVWVGSGFIIKELPPYRTSPFLYYHDPCRICGWCGSMDTRCLYLANFVHQFGVDITAEVACLRCSKYTTYKAID
jgi:hypothetical protein